MQTRQTDDRVSRMERDELLIEVLAFRRAQRMDDRSFAATINELSEMSTSELRTEVRRHLAG